MKVSEGCKNCYAETLDNRWKGGHWGPSGSRREMSEEYWKQPVKWNKAAAASGKKAKVFCASMADVFEGTDTCSNADAYAVIFQARIRLFTLIYETPHLTWQLLTKRPENIMTVLNEVARVMPHAAVRQWLHAWIFRQPPANVWIGTSVENQATAEVRIPYLLRVPASVRFLSCEPLLGPIDLSVIFGLYEYDDNKYAPKCGSRWASSPDWIIAGGESGHGARPMHPDWVRMLRDQCAAADVPFFFKQWGEWWPGEKGRLYEAKTVNYTDGQQMVKVGKKVSGRLLDGKEHSEFPII